MPKRYVDEEAKFNITTETVVDEYSCPDCGFSFNAEHTCDDSEGGYICPLCEAAELQEENGNLKYTVKQFMKANENQQKEIERLENMLKELSDYYTED